MEETVDVTDVPRPFSTAGILSVRYRSGIYAIRNKINGKSYVGSSGNFRMRWKEHRRRLRERRHHSPALQHAWNKYGEDSFDWVILELCERERAVLIAREQHWMDDLKSFGGGYNVVPFANSCLGFKHTEEFKARLSLIKTGIIPSDETRAKMSAAKKGTVLTEEIRRNMSLGQLRRTTPHPNLGRLLPDSHRANIAKAAIGRQISEETRTRMQIAYQARKGLIEWPEHLNTPELKAKREKDRELKRRRKLERKTETATEQSA